MIPTKVQTYEPGDICALSFDNPDEEGAFIAATIRDLHGVAFAVDGKERGLSYSDMAIRVGDIEVEVRPHDAIPSSPQSGG